MTVIRNLQQAPSAEGFQHDALFYDGVDGFLEQVVPFVQDGISAGDPILVAVSPEKIKWLRSTVRADDAAVRFVNMDELGQNPAQIIPAWRDFVAENAGRSHHFRGVGEPIWPGRSEAELAECHLHEALLNVAFERGPAWWLVCPYDWTALEPAVLEEAQRTHPRVVRHDVIHEVQPTGTSWVRGRFDAPFPEPGGSTEMFTFDATSLGVVRDVVAERVRRSRIDPSRGADFVLAVHEAATNSVRHGGGSGTLRSWEEERTLICEVRDAGSIDDPLVGRQRPSIEENHGRGLWLANHLCDLVQVRSLRDGVTVRLHAGVRPEGFEPPTF